MLDEWLSYYRNMQEKEFCNQIEISQDKENDLECSIKNIRLNNANSNVEYDDDEEDDDDEDDDEDDEDDDEDDEDDDEDDYEDQYCEEVNVQ